MASHIPAMGKPSRAQHPEHVPDFKCHRRKCVICHHPQREAIEELFVDWHSPETISDLFDLDDWSTIYRHAHATGLFRRRRRNVRSALERIIERADVTPVAPLATVRAVRAYACLTDTGEWIEPATHVIVSRGEPRAETTLGETTAEPAVHVPTNGGPDHVAPARLALAHLAPVRRQQDGAAHVPGEGSVGDRSPQLARLAALPALPPAPSADSPAPQPAPAPVEEPLISLARVRPGFRPGGRISNRQPTELETALTRSQQRSAPRANRQK